MRLRVRTEIGYYRIEAGSARFADLSSHSQPHKLVIENDDVVSEHFILKRRLQLLLRI